MSSGPQAFDQQASDHRRLATRVTTAQGLGCRVQGLGFRAWGFRV